MANIDFDPRQRGDREQMKFGATGSSVDSTVVFIKIGGQAKDVDGTTPGEVSENQSIQFKTDLAGRLFVSEMHPRFFNVSTSYTAAQTNIHFKENPGSGLYLYLTDVVYSAGENAGTITLRRGTDESTLVYPPIYMSAGNSYQANLRTPLKLSVDTSIRLTSAISGTHSVVINGFIAS